VINGSQVKWTSTGEAHEITGLQIGVEYTIRNTAAPKGYTVHGDVSFSISEDGQIYSNTMGSNGVLLVEFDESTGYTIEIYTMGTDGEYGEPEVETKTANVGYTVKYQPEVRNGFTVDVDASRLEATAEADGSTVLSVYYLRNRYALNIVTDGTDNKTEYYYGAAVDVPADPTRTGYTFNGWDVVVPATMPAENVTITAKWTVTEYEVEIKQPKGGKVETDNDAVLWAVKNGITAGTSDTTFSPAADCSRAQIVTFLYRCFGDEE